MATPGMSITERLRLRREDGRRLLHKIGAVQIAEGVICIILGTVALIYAAPNSTYVYFIGTPLWTGLLVLPAGVLAWKASQIEDLPGNLVSTCQKRLIVANYTLTITSMTPAIMILVYAGIGIAWCAGPPPQEFADACLNNHSENYVTSIISIVVGSVVGLSTIPFTVFFCLYGRAFGLRVNSYALSEPDPLVAEQMREQAQTIMEQQAEIARLAERQQAVEKRLATGSSGWMEDAPPPYDEPLQTGEDVKTAI